MWSWASCWLMWAPSTGRKHETCAVLDIPDILTLEASGIKLLLLAIADARIDEDEVILAKEEKSVVADGKNDMESVSTEEGSMLDASGVDEDVAEATVALAVILGSTEEGLADVALNVLVSSVEVRRSDENDDTTKELVDAVSDADGLAEVATREEEISDMMLSLEMEVADDGSSVDKVGGRVATVLDSNSVDAVDDATTAVSLVLTGIEGVADTADDVETVFESVGTIAVLESVVEVAIALSVVEITAVSVVDAVLLPVLDTTALSVLDGAMLCVVETAALSVVEESRLSVVEGMMLSDVDVKMLSVVGGIALLVVDATALSVVDAMELSVVGTMVLLVVDTITLSVVDVIASSLVLLVVGTITLSVVDAITLSLVGMALLSVVEITTPVSVLDAALLSVVGTILSVAG